MFEWQLFGEEMEARLVEESQWLMGVRELSLVQEEGGYVCQP